MVCSVNPNANTIAKKLCEINPSLNLDASTVSKKIEQGIENGYLSREEVYPENEGEGVDYTVLLDKVLQMLGDQADIDTEFDLLSPVVVSSTEGFSGDIARASRATHYIGVNKQDGGGFQMKMQAAMLTGGRQVVDENTAVDENTVALVEVTTSSDLNLVLQRCEKVLDAGGRLLMPTSKEVAEYANKIKDKDKRATYEKTRLALQQAFIDRGYSAREVNEQGGLQAQVIQSIRVQSFDKITFAKDTSMGKVKALNDGVSAKDVVRKAKKMNVSVKAAFVNKEGVSNKDERVSSPTLYEAILAGEVNAIARQDSKNNQYSSLKKGDVIPLRQDADHIIYAEVTDVTPTNKAGYIDMLNNGDIVTGYSVASARELMADDKAYTVVQFKPLVEGGRQKKEKTKKKRKGAKSSKDQKTTYVLRYKYDKKAKKMRFWREKVSVSKTDQEDMNTTNFMNALAKAQMEFYKKMGIAIEVMPDEQVQKELQQVTSDTFQKKMEEASDEEKRVMLHEMGESVHKQVLERTHSFTNNQSGQHNLLINLFKGNYVRMNQFGKSMMQYFRRMAENAVIDEKLEEYRNELVGLNGMIESGLNEDGKYALRKELNDYKRQVQAINDKISRLENDGWLGAVTMSDVLTKTFEYVKSEMRYALQIKDYIAEESKEGGKLYEKDDREKLRIVSERFGEKNIAAWNYYNFVKADKVQPFLDEIFDGYHDDQWAAIKAKGTSSEQLAEIRAKRKQSDAVFDALWERVCKEIQKTTGVPVIYKVKDGSGTSDILNEDDESEEERLDEDGAAPESDMEKEEESSRDIQMVANYERDVTSTLSQKVKRLLASQYDWDFKRTELKGTAEERNARVAPVLSFPKSTNYTYEIYRDENGDATHVVYFQPSKDSMFFQPKTVPAGVVFNKLLAVMSDAHGGTGMRNGEELYQYLRSNMEKVAWYHGIVKEMERDPSAKTALFVALRLRHMNFRAAETRKSYYGNKNLYATDKQQHNSIVSIAENYDENSEFVLGQIQENMNHGIVAEKGVVGGVKVDINKRKTYTTISQFQNKILFGTGIQLRDISLYDNTGNANIGTIKGEDDGNGNIRNVTELTGAVGFYYLVNSIPRTVKNAKNLFLNDPDMVLHKMYHALRALGLDITRDEMDLAFAAQPYKIKDCIAILQEIGNAVDPLDYRAWSQVYKGFETKLISDYLSGYLKTLSETVSGVSQMRPEQNARWAGKNYHSWATPSLVDEVIDNLGNTETEEDFMEYVNKRYLHSDDQSIDSSFFMQRDANGNVEVLNTWLRNMIPASNKEADVKKAMFFRNMFKLGYYDHLGVPGSKPGMYKEYKRMEEDDKVLVEALAFFSPKYANKDLFEKARANNPDLLDNIDLEQHGYKAACYAFPVMADSSNHMFYGARRYTTKRNRDESIAEGYSLDSHIKDSLLDGCADVVMQEYHRIKVFMSNAKDGQALKRPEMSKTFNKNKEKFCNFPDLNNVAVRILPKGVNAQYIEMPFLEAIEYLATADNIEELTDSVAVSKDGERWYNVSRTEGVELYRDMIMEAMHKCYLNDSTKRSIKEWRNAGAIKVGKLQSEDDTFEEAFKQNNDRTEKVNALVSELFGVQLKVVGNARKGYSFQKIATEDNPLANLSSQLKESAIWNELSSYSDPSMGIEKGQLTFTLLDMTSEYFNYGLYELNEKERIAEEARQNSIIGAIVGILDKYNNGEKTPGINNLLDYFKLKSRTPSLNYRNLLFEALQEYAWNKTFAKTQILQLTVGDIAQFKNEGDLSKRYKGVAGAYERVDMTAVDVNRGNRLVKEYYGEEKIEDEFWQENQKTIVLADFEAKADPKTNRTTGFHNISQFFNDQLLPKLQMDLEAGVISEQEYADFCDGYSKMCMTDGQSFRTIQSMKKICDFLHLNTKGMDEIYQAVVDGKKLRWEQVRDYIQQMKSFSFGFEQLAVDYSARGYGETEGVTQLKRYAQQLTDFTKDSQYTLMLYTEEMSEYLGGDSSIMKGLYDFCVENQVDCVHFASTKKTALTRVVDISQCKDAAEVKAMLNNAKAVGEQDETKSLFHAEPWKYVGRQISTKEHLFDKEQGVGSQIEKLVAADCPDTYETSVVNKQTGEVEKKTFKTEIIIRDDKGNPAAKLTPQQYREMLTRIKITNMREDLMALEKRLGSKEEFAKLLIDQLDRTDKYPEDLLEAIKYNPSTGDFTLSLDNPTIFNAIQPIVASLIRKKVIKQKTRGGTAIQFSSVGRTNNLKEVWGETEDGQKYVKYIECMLPAWSKSLFRAFADKDGNIDINDIPVKMREMVGYRVPTEHIYSMAPLRVVGFLNQEQGSSIMLPQEIVVWAGSDYDIDKVYLEMPDFRITDEKEALNNAKPKVWQEFYGSIYGQEYLRVCHEHWRDAVKKYIEANQLEEDKRLEYEALLGSSDAEAWRKFRKEYCEAVGVGKGNLYDILVIDKDSVEQGFTIEDLRHDFIVFCEREGYYDVTVKTSDVASPAEIANMDMKDWQKALESVSRMDRNNMFVALHFARLTCPQTLMLLNTPGGFAAQSKMAKIATVLSSGESKLSFSELQKLSLDELSEMAEVYAPRMDIMDAATDDIMFKRNMTGKQMVAVSALHNAFHAVMQAAPTKLSAQFKSLFNFTLNGKPMRDVLGGIFDEAGRYITRNIGGFLAAAVDTAKDPVIGYLNFNQRTAGYFFALLHMGYSIETVTLLMNQPIVRKYFQEYPYLSESDLADLGVSLDDSLHIDMTHEEMASAMTRIPADTDLVTMFSDPVQQRAISILLKVYPICKAIEVLMKATKITQPKNSMQNSLGRTYEQMLPVRNKLNFNTTKSKQGDINVFDPTEFETLVMDKFDMGNDVPMSVDDYINGVMMPDGKLRKPRLPLVQAAYDYGFSRPLRYLSRYIGAYGRDTMSLIERLENLGRGDYKLTLNAAIIDKMITHRRIFSTMSYLCEEDFAADPAMQTVSDVRSAYLLSFPQYFRDFLKNYRETGTYNGVKREEVETRDLTQEYSILRHIIYDERDKGRYGDAALLRLTKGGKVDKMVQNDLVSSWDLMFRDPDEHVQNLALQLYKYSMFYNGASFAPNAFGGYAPSSILHEFPEYDAALRDLSDSMTDDEKDLFIDQFIRNNMEYFYRAGLIPSVRKEQLEKDAFEKVEANEKAYGQKSYWKLKKEVLHLSADLSKQLYGANYFVVNTDTGNSFHFRRQKDSDGNDCWMHVEELGMGHFPEYDSEHDLVKAGSLRYTSYRDVALARMTNVAAAKKELQEKAAKEAQAETLQKLSELSSTISDDRSAGMGNDSTAYIKDGERYMRTHDYMKEKLHRGELSIPKDKDGNPKFNQIQWDRLCDIGRTLGSVFDTYARLYFKELTYGPLSESDRLLRESLFDFTNGPLAQHKIMYRFGGRELAIQEQVDWFEKELQGVCADIKNQFPGATFYTELNGRPIRICNEVMTSNGPVKVGGEIDMLVANPDGTFTIVDFKQINERNLNYYLQGALQEKMEEEGNSYYDHQTQLNIYRSIMKSLFPDMDISLCVAPFITVRGFCKFDRLGKMERITNRISETGEDWAQVQHVQPNTRSYYPGVTRTMVIDMIADPTVSKIPDPIKTTQQEKDEKLAEQQEEIEKEEQAAQPAQSGEVHSYTDIFAQYLTPQQMSETAYVELTKFLDKKESLYFDNEAKSRKFSSEEYRKKILERIMGKAKSGKSGFYKVLSGIYLDFEDNHHTTRLDSETVDKIVESILRNKDVLGDDNIKIC